MIAFLHHPPFRYDQYHICVLDCCETVCYYDHSAPLCFLFKHSLYLALGLGVEVGCRFIKPDLAVSVYLSKLAQNILHDELGSENWFPGDF
jgi:hypothetical protein